MPKPPTPTPADEALPLREACLRAAREAIAEHGVEHLSLRDVARRLNVSHQAPYKHFPSRDHLLAEVMRRCFECLMQALQASPPLATPQAEVRRLGAIYLDFALARPAEYRLMFNAPWPALPEELEAGLRADARQPLDLLRAQLARLHGQGAAARKKVDLDALAIWCTLHGLATISQGHVTERMALAPGVQGALDAHVLDALVRGLPPG